MNQDNFECNYPEIDTNKEPTTKALILVAGRGTRINKFSKETPKTLLEVGGKPILGHIVDRILENKIQNIVVVVGYKKEQIINFLRNAYPNINFKFIENNNYGNTNTLYSMWLAREELKEGFLYFHGDLIFNKNILKELINPKYKNGAIVEPHAESMEVYGFDNIIVKFSKKKDAVGKALGIYKFSKEATERLFEETEKIIGSGQINTFQSTAINSIIIHHRMDLISTSGMSWVEVDEEKDFQDAERILKKISEEEAQSSKELKTPRQTEEI